MDGLAFARGLAAKRAMPMAQLFAFELVNVERGEVVAFATPQATHDNPFEVSQGGFAATVLDMALGIVGISVLDGDAVSVATTDLTVRYVRPIRSHTGRMTIRAKTTHAGRTVVIAEAELRDEAGTLFALAQSNSIVTRERAASGKRAFRGFDHLDTRVRSLAAVRPFYDALMDRLGLTERRFVMVRGDEWSYVDETQAHNAVEYIEADAAAGQAQFFGVIESESQTEGETRVAFAIGAPADFAEIERFLASSGAKNVRRSEDENVYPAIFFEDPLGNRLELRARA